MSKIARDLEEPDRKSQESANAESKPTAPPLGSSNTDKDVAPDTDWSAWWPHNEEDLEFSERGHRRTRSISKIKNDKEEKVHVQETAPGHPNSDDSEIATAEAAEDFVDSMFDLESTADLENVTSEASQSHSETSTTGREIAKAIHRKEMTKDCERVGVEGNLGILEPMKKAYASTKGDKLIQGLAKAREIREEEYRKAREEQGRRSKGEGGKGRKGGVGEDVEGINDWRN
jgi:hypothetical protein